MPKSNYHLLIVEDDGIARELLKQIFSGLPLKISECENALDALKFLEINNVDIIITDIVMPVMDGLTLTSKLKASQEFKQIPVVVITAQLDPELISRAFEQGATDYISKPLQRHEVLARINNILYRKSAEDKWMESKAIITLQNEQLQAKNNQLNHIIADLQEELAITKEKVSELIKSWSEASFKSSDIALSNATLLQQVADLMHKIANLKSKNTELNAILKDNQRNFDSL